VLVAPLDDHGTLGVGVDEPGGFTAYTRPLVELLASNLAAALDRIEREQELRTYETVLESVQDTVYVCGPDGRFSYVTEPLADLLGRDRAELVGTNLVDVLAEPDRTVGARIDQLRAGDADSVAVETTLASTTGKEIPVEIELSLYPGETFAGTVGVVRDRSELLATERALRSERDRFGYLFDNLPDAVVDVSFGDGPVVESANAAFASAFGDGERIVGRSVDDLLATDEHGEALTRAVADGETVETEVSRSTTAGTRHYLFRGIPYRTPDGDRRGFGIYTDITERERRERRLQVLNRVLRHNLRNEFSVIVGYAEQLAATLDDEDGDLAGKLAAKTHEVIDLVNRIREVGATLDRAEDAARETDVGDFLRAVVTEAGVDPPATATVEAPEGLSAAVDDRLRLAVGELVGNAVEHNEAASITVSASAEDGALVVSVADDGSGIPDHEWAVVTGEADITQLSHGSGVGLWAVRWVVDSYDGRLDRRERPDGTEIRLRLPDLI
jgi:PAS domain S-box-containing protein